MTNISKRRTNTEHYKLAYSQFASVIANLNKTNAPKLLEGLLTESEQIMLVKRLAAVLMLEQGHSSYEVCRIIGISLSTAQRIQLQYESGHFDSLLNCVPKVQKSEFLSLLQDFLLSRASYKARTRLMRRAMKS